MINLPISVLDLALVQSGSTTGRALAQMIAFARRAEQLGFSRFWVAEHHGSPTFASTVPPVLVARVAAHTSSIRVGSGGVMLPNHSPLVVAEQFGTLGAFDPGRIDLGVGKGPGSVNAAYTDVLRRGAPPVSDEDYASQVRTLLSYLTPDESRGVRVSIAEDNPPQVWLLASSEASAALAAELGLPISIAHHIRPANTEPALAVYRERFKPSRWLDRPYAMVSTSVICAETDEHAEELAQPADVLAAQFLTGQGSKFPTPEEAARHRFTPTEADFIGTLRNGQLRGGPETIGRHLTELVSRLSPDELILATPLYDIEDRTRSLELITEWVVCPRSPAFAEGDTR
jgi:luciferase family oxidoreductase group 1